MTAGTAETPGAPREAALTTDPQPPSAGAAEPGSGTVLNRAPETRDDRWEALVAASARLRTALDDYRAPLIDRGIAEQELTALHRMAAGGAADPAALSGRLLLVASAVGSVRVLSPALAELRAAVGRFGPGVTSVTVIPPPRR